MPPVAQRTGAFLPPHPKWRTWLCAHFSPSRLGLVSQEILEPVDIVLAVLDVRVSNQAAKQRQRRLDALDDEFIERSSEPHQSFGSRSAVNDQLADQEIIIGRDHVTLIGRRIDANAEASGG